MSKHFLHLKIFYNTPNVGCFAGDFYRLLPGIQDFTIPLSYTFHCLIYPDTA
jgi:hypothetical protein